MANDCLVTKLKEVVQNSSLPYLNGLRINFYATTDYEDDMFTCSIRIPAGTVIVSDTGDPFYVGESSYTRYEAQAAGDIVVRGINKDYSISILDGYSKVVVFGTSHVYGRGCRIGLDMRCLPYLSISSMGLYHNDSIGDYRVSELPENIYNFVVQSMALVCNIEEIVFKGRSLSLLSLCGGYGNTRNEKISGSIESGNFVENIFKLTNNLTIQFINTAISGSLANFAAALVAKGKTSGTITFTCSGSPAIITPGSKRDNLVVTFDSSLPNGYSIA